MNNSTNIAIDFKNYDGKDSEFSGTDTKEVFIKNLGIHGRAWHYAKTNIFYKRNSLGYRSKDLSEINHDNFFLTMGCSYTEGTGLALDETWSYQISESLGMDYINHAKGGGGADLIYLNSVLFLKNTQVRPKFVVIQWPEPSRIMYKNLNDLRLCGINFPTPDYTRELYDVMLKHNGHIFNTHWAYVTTQLLWKLAGIPVINWEMFNFYNQELGITHDLTILVEDVDRIDSNKARDCRHYGLNYNRRVSERLLDYIKNTVI